MRKTVLTLAGLGALATAGFLLAGVGISPKLAAALGILVLALAALTQSTPDRIVWLTTCLFVLTVTWNGVRLGGGAFGNVFLAVAGASVLGSGLVTGRSLVMPPWLLLAGLGMFLAALLTAIFPPAPSLINKSDVALLSQQAVAVNVYLAGRPDIAYFVKYEAALVLVPIILIEAGRTRARCIWLLDLFVASATVSGVVAVTNYAHITAIGRVPLSGQRALGLTLHPNYLALTSTIAIPLALMWLNRADVRWRVAGGLSVAALVGSVYASGSRVGAVTALLAVILGVMALPRLRRSLFWVLPLVGMIAVVVLAFTPTGHTILHQVRLEGGSDAGRGANTAGSDFARLNVARVAYEEIQARPIHGVGFSVIGDAHDIYLELLAAGGVIALASFAVFCGGVASAASRAMRGPHRDVATACSLGIILWLVNGVLDNQVADKYLYVVPGLLLAVSRLDVREAIVEPPPAVRAREPAVTVPPPAAVPA